MTKNDTKKEEDEILEVFGIRDSDSDNSYSDNSNNSDNNSNSNNGEQESNGQEETEEVMSENETDSDNDSETESNYMEYSSRKMTRKNLSNRKGGAPRGRFSKKNTEDRMTIEQVGGRMKFGFFNAETKLTSYNIISGDKKTINNIYDNSNNYYNYFGAFHTDKNKGFDFTYKKTGKSAGVGETLYFSPSVLIRRRYNNTNKLFDLADVGTRKKMGRTDTPTIYEKYNSIEDVNTSKDRDAFLTGLQKVGHYILTKTQLKKISNIDESDKTIDSNIDNTIKELSSFMESGGNGTLQAFYNFRDLIHKKVTNKDRQKLYYLYPSPYQLTGNIRDQKVLYKDGNAFKNSNLLVKEKMIQKLKIATNGEKSIIFYNNTPTSRILSGDIYYQLIDPRSGYEGEEKKITEGFEGALKELSKEEPSQNNSRGTAEPTGEDGESAAGPEPVKPPEPQKENVSLDEISILKFLKEDVQSFLTPMTKFTVDKSKGEDLPTKLESLVEAEKTNVMAKIKAKFNLNMKMTKSTEQKNLDEYINDYITGQMSNLLTKEKDGVITATSLGGFDTSPGFKFANDESQDKKYYHAVNYDNFDKFSKLVNSVELTSDTGEQDDPTNKLKNSIITLIQTYMEKNNPGASGQGGPDEAKGKGPEEPGGPGQKKQPEEEQKPTEGLSKYIKLTGGRPSVIGEKLNILLEELGVGLTESQLVQGKRKSSIVLSNQGKSDEKSDLQKFLEELREIYRIKGLNQPENQPKQSQNIEEKKIEINESIELLVEFFTAINLILELIGMLSDHDFTLKETDLDGISDDELGKLIIEIAKTRYLNPNTHLLEILNVFEKDKDSFKKSLNDLRIKLNTGDNKLFSSAYPESTGSESKENNLVPGEYRLTKVNSASTGGAKQVGGGNIEYQLEFFTINSESEPRTVTFEIIEETGMLKIKNEEGLFHPSSSETKGTTGSTGTREYNTFYGLLTDLKKNKNNRINTAYLSINIEFPNVSGFTYILDDVDSITGSIISVGGDELNVQKKDQNAISNIFKKKSTSKEAPEKSQQSEALKDTILSSVLGEGSNICFSIFGITNPMYGAHAGSLPIRYTLEGEGTGENPPKKTVSYAEPISHRSISSQNPVDTWESRASTGTTVSTGSKEENQPEKYPTYFIEFIKMISSKLDGDEKINFLEFCRKNKNHIFTIDLFIYIIFELKEIEDFKEIDNIINRPIEEGTIMNYDDFIRFYKHFGDDIFGEHITVINNDFIKPMEKYLFEKLKAFLETDDNLNDLELVKKFLTEILLTLYQPEGSGVQYFYIKGNTPDEIKEIIQDVSVNMLSIFDDFILYYRFLKLMRPNPKTGTESTAQAAEPKEEDRRRISTLVTAFKESIYERNKMNSGIRPASYALINDETEPPEIEHFTSVPSKFNESYTHRIAIDFSNLFIYSDLSYQDVATTPAGIPPGEQSTQKNIYQPSMCQNLVALALGPGKNFKDGTEEKENLFLITHRGDMNLLNYEQYGGLQITHYLEFYFVDDKDDIICEIDTPSAEGKIPFSDKLQNYFCNNFPKEEEQDSFTFYDYLSKAQGMICKKEGGEYIANSKLLIVAYPLNIWLQELTHSRKGISGNYFPPKSISIMLDITDGGTYESVLQSLNINRLKNNDKEPKKFDKEDYENAVLQLQTSKNNFTKFLKVNEKNLQEVEVKSESEKIKTKAAKKQTNETTVPEPQFVQNAVYEIMRSNVVEVVDNSHLADPDFNNIIYGVNTQDGNIRLAGDGYNDNLVYVTHNPAQSSHTESEASQGTVKHKAESYHSVGSIVSIRFHGRDQSTWSFYGSSN